MGVNLIERGGTKYSFALGGEGSQWYILQHYTMNLTVGKFLCLMKEESWNLYRIWSCSVPLCAYTSKVVKVSIFTNFLCIFSNWIMWPHTQSVIILTCSVRAKCLLKSVLYKVN